LPRETALLPRLIVGIRRERLTLPESAAVKSTLNHSLNHRDSLVAAVILALDLTAPATTPYSVRHRLGYRPRPASPSGAERW